MQNWLHRVSVVRRPLSVASLLMGLICSVEMLMAFDAYLTTWMSVVGCPLSVARPLAERIRFDRGSHSFSGCVSFFPIELM